MKDPMIFRFWKNFALICAKRKERANWISIPIPGSVVDRLKVFSVRFFYWGIRWSGCLLSISMTGRLSSSAAAKIFCLERVFQQAGSLFLYIEWIPGFVVRSGRVLFSWSQWMAKASLHLSRGGTEVFRIELKLSSSHLSGKCQSDLLPSRPAAIYLSCVE